MDSFIYNTGANILILFIIGGIPIGIIVGIIYGIISAFGGVIGVHIKPKT